MESIDNIRYNPKLSIEQNAKLNGLSGKSGEERIRYYIRANGIDRRQSKKVEIVNAIRKYLKKHPDATKLGASKDLPYGINTIRKYWDIARGNGEIEQNKNKASKRERLAQEQERKRIEFLDSLPIEYIKEYLNRRESNVETPVSIKPIKPIQKPIEVPLTEEDLSKSAQAKRALVSMANGLKRKASGKDVILNGVEIPFNPKSYPIDDVILYSSKVEPQNRMLGHHYECLIEFRGVEFYGVEQMHSALKFNERPYILNDIMTATNGVQAKRRSHKYSDLSLYDSDYNIKDARITALCFLFKYLSVKEYRDRMRELRGKVLYEHKGEYEGGNRMNADKTMLVGNNLDGRLMMAVRDMMLKYEDEALQLAEEKKGGTLTNIEREQVLNEILSNVRHTFENDKQVKKDTDNVIRYIKEHSDIIPLKRYWPGEDAKAILIEFDNCVFNTSVDNEVRKAKGAKITNWKKFYKEYIPQYELHDGWKEVFKWADENGILIGVIGKAKKELVEETFNQYGLRYNAIVYAGNASRQHGYDIIDNLKIKPQQVIGYISGTKQGQKQAEANGFRFYGATWDTSDLNVLSTGTTISKPTEIIDILERV